MLGFVRGHGPHHHLRTESIDHGQHSPRRDIGVCHTKLPRVGARANNLERGGVDLSTIGSAAPAGLIYLACASFIEA